MAGCPEKLVRQYHNCRPTSLLVIIVSSIKLSVLVRQLYRGNEEVVLFITGVCAKDETVDGVVFAFWPTWNK